MAKTKPIDPSRKQRTREHILEDLSVHHIRGLVLRCGFTMEQTTEDYGLDLWMQTYDDNGEVENDLIWMQVKAAERLKSYIVKREECFSYPVNMKDVRLWTGSALPVYLILYDAALDEAYWLNTDDILMGERKLAGKHKRLRVPRANVLGAQNLQLMREHKNALVQKYQS